jgi:hypothetical protein
MSCIQNHCEVRHCVSQFSAAACISHRSSHKRHEQLSEGVYNTMRSSRGCQSSV